jgi:hypothetical protein
MWDSDSDGASSPIGLTLDEQAERSAERTWRTLRSVEQKVRDTLRALFVARSHPKRARVRWQLHQECSDVADSAAEADDDACVCAASRGRAFVALTSWLAQGIPSLTRNSVEGCWHRSPHVRRVVRCVPLHAVRGRAARPELASQFSTLQLGGNDDS